MFSVEGRVFPQGLSRKHSEPELLTRHYGDPALAPPATVALHAGPLSLVYTANGDLRYIRYGNQEILRRIYPAVRAGDWWTVPSTLTEREWEIGEDAFRIVYEARYTAEDRGIDFLATVTITGDTTGEIVYDFDGEPVSAFERKRIGICVLHPAEIKGAACTVTHTDASTEEGAFPDLIAPHQPFFDIAGVSHSVVPGVTAHVTFSGDVFEMEDQRNWLDASFKTYSTPLALPSPILVQPGERIRQTVTLSVDIAPDAAPPAEAPETVTVTIGKPLSDPPSIGLRWTIETRLSKVEARRLKNYGIGHLWVDLDMARPRWKDALRRADKAAQEAGIKLHVLLRNVYEYTNRVNIQDVKFPILTAPVLWFVASEKDWHIADPYFGTRYYVPLGVGSVSNFTELNRTRPHTWKDSPLFFAGNPQVHAFDSLSIMETPTMIPEAVRTAKSFAGERPIHLGPMTLYGPYQSEEPRHYSEMGAAWYTAALSYALKSGVESITLCDVAGPHVYCSTKDQYNRFGEILSKLNFARPASICPLETSSPDVTGFVFQGEAEYGKGTSRTNNILLLVNLASSQTEVAVSMPNGQVMPWPDSVESLSHSEMMIMVPATVEDGVFECALTPHSVTVCTFWE